MRNVKWIGNNSCKNLIHYDGELFREQKSVEQFFGGAYTRVPECLVDGEGDSIMLGRWPRNRSSEYELI